MDICSVRGVPFPPRAPARAEVVRFDISSLEVVVDIAIVRRWAHMVGKVVFESEHDAGGHFAAVEQPDKLAGDLRKMFGKGGPAYGVVSGKDGY